ncbi:MAG: class I SAM-dependent methyltransferase [Pseudoxanthomonas sp.]
MNDKIPATQRVVADYFRTTSASGSAASNSHFDASMRGLVRRLSSWLDVKGLFVVDLGSGTGELCKCAIDSGASKVVGVNLSAEEIEYARTQCSADFVLSDIGGYLASIPADSVDRIYALNILEHLGKDQLVNVLEGAHRALKPGGALVAMVPNATSPFGGMTRYWDFTHEIAFTPSSVNQLAKLVGFGKPPAFRECGPVPYGVVSTIRYLLWQVIRLGIRFRLLVELASGKSGIYTADMMFRIEK